MQKTLVFFITFYQQYVSILLSHIVGRRTICRYEVTCSEYAKRAIAKKGAIIGIYLASRRILSCQPFFNTKNNGRNF